MELSILWEYREALWDGFTLTVTLSLIAIFGSFVLGALVGCIGVIPNYFAQRASQLYVETLRNIPVVVKLFFLYYALALDAWPAALIALITHSSAYIADVVASGFRTIPREQTESALSSGLSYQATFLHILLPQAFRNVIPPTTTQFIEVIKNSSIVMLISLEEMTFQTQRIETETFRGFEAATAVTILYLVVSLTVATLMSLLDRRLRL